MTVYQIMREKPGQRAEDVTPNLSYNASRTIGGEYFTDEAAARQTLADWFTNWQYDWLTLEDEDGVEKAEKRILDGYPAEDGDGVRYYVREFTVLPEDEEQYSREFEQARRY